MPADHVHGPVDRVALADAAEVDLHAGAVERHRPSRRIEPEMMPAGPGPGVGERLRVGNPLRTADEAPGFGECPRGHVVGTAGLPAELDGPLEQAEKPGLDLDGAEMGGRVQPADLGIVGVNGQLGLELVDQIECPARQVDGAGDLRAQADLEERAHGRPVDPHQLRRGRRGRLPTDAHIPGRRLGPTSPRRCAGAAAGHGG